MKANECTDHQAATFIAADRIRASQEAVLRVLRRLGRATDSDIIHEFNQLVQMGYEAEQSPSGIRTRRAELVALNEVVDTLERRTLPTGRKSIIWTIPSLKEYRRG